MANFSRIDMGARIKESRKKSKKTQAQIAMKMGISRNTLSNYESGNTSPDCDFLYKFSKACHASIDYLITGKEYGVEDASFNEITSLFNRLSLKEKNSIICILRGMVK